MNDYTTDTTYYYYTSNDAAAGALGAGIAAGTIVFGFIVFVIAYVVMALLLGQIFKKAGEPKWIAWVPVYNTWKFYELGGQQGFWAILAFIPFVNIVAAVFYYIAAYNIGLKLGKSGAFVVLDIFLPIVWMAILALDHSTWQGAQPAQAVADPVTTPPSDQTPPTPPASTPPVA